MPELPEVESLRRSLVPFVVGQTIRKVTVLKPKLVSASGTVRQPLQHKVEEFQKELANQKIDSITRVAKNLIFQFESGKILLIHLKMTGQLVYQGDGKTNTKSETIWGGHPIELTNLELPNKHSHIIFELDDGTLYFNDTRMFGYLLYYPTMESLLADKHFDKLGLDPSDPEFTLEYFVQKMKSKTGVLKAVFLNQEVVVGLGNIYADEVCFMAGVRPTRKVNTLTKKELSRLHEAVTTIIPLAINEGGSSVANYLLADGTRGNYAKMHQVYNRGGKPCYICGNPLTSIKLAGRTTVYCKFDQK
jgi:formamidopyrimidine-DNA glycosylase